MAGEHIRLLEHRRPRAKAKRRLPLGGGNMSSGGSRTSWASPATAPGSRRSASARMCCAMSRRSTPRPTLLGTPSSFPLAVAPTGAAGLLWYQGDLALAKAAARAGVPFTICSASTMDMDQIAPAGGRLWFQLYMWADRSLSHAVDRPRAGSRLRGAAGHARPAGAAQPRISLPQRLRHAVPAQCAQLHRHHAPPALADWA